MTGNDELKAKREWLSRAFYLDKCIRNLQREKEHDAELLRVDCTGCTVSYDSSGASRGTAGNSTENKLIRYVDEIVRYESDILRAEAEYCHAKSEIKCAISKVESQLERDVLTKRYINFMKVNEIAKESNYSVRHTKRLLQNGTAHIECHLLSLT